MSEVPSTISIRAPQDIPIILDYIHDCWFDVDDISFDARARTLSIKFKREPKTVRVFRRELPDEPLAVGGFIIFHHVKSYTVHDTEHVGMYDFKTLKYDSDLGRISILTGIPIDIEVVVHRFEISLEDIGGGASNSAGADLVS